MKNPMCGGCPDGCGNCVFASKGENITGEERVVQSAKVYECKKGFGDIVRDAAGRLGQIRNGMVHYLRESGIAFLKKTKNPLLEVGLQS